MINECDLFPLRDMSYAGLKVKVPNNYDKILRVKYGSYMNAPTNLQTHLDEVSLKEIVEKYRNHLSNMR